MYDVDRDGYVTKKELTRVLTQMLSTMYPDEDPTYKVNDIVIRLFEDLDVNEDGNLVGFERSDLVGF
jgi:Ca2+-binding EF-hand superfamily protein